MKEIKGPIWYQTNKDGTVSIGLTNEYIQKRCSECFHIMQADLYEVAVNQPMLVLETNDGLDSIPSPVSGHVVNFNWRARDFPDKLTEEESILTIKPKEKEPVKKPAKIEQPYYTVFNRV